MIGPERVESDADKRRFDVKRYLPTALRSQDKTVKMNFAFSRIEVIRFCRLATAQCLAGSSILCDEENRNDNHVFTGKSLPIDHSSHRTTINIDHVRLTA